MGGREEESASGATASGDSWSLSLPLSSRVRSKGLPRCCIWLKPLPENLLLISSGDVVLALLVGVASDSSADTAIVAPRVRVRDGSPRLVVSD